LDFPLVDRYPDSSAACVVFATGMHVTFPPPILIARPLTATQSGKLYVMKNREPRNGMPEKTGLTLFAMVGGFILLIMILGWLIVSLR
jgi:hypothetical protein